MISAPKAILSKFTGNLRLHRLNYILWVQDLLDTTSDEYLDQYDPNRDVIGMDMYVLHSPRSLCTIDQAQWNRSELYLPSPRLPPETEMDVRRNR